MTLLQMSFTGAVLILAILTLRAFLLDRLPKQTFLILWGLALLKLLIPVAIPAPCSIYSVLDHSLAADFVEKLSSSPSIPSKIKTGQTDTGSQANAPAESSLAASVQTGNTDVLSSAMPPATAETPTDTARNAQDTAPRFILSLIWCAGAVLCAAFYLFSYLRCRLEFGTSLPVGETAAVQWLTAWQKAYPMRRSVSVRQSDRVDAPLTYGILRPVILLPKVTNWEDMDSLRYILAHEYVHIRRLDAVTKLLMTLALSLHWFNPLVWTMYFLFNRDLELACDEKVIRQFGEPCKSAYAHMLVDMEARKSGHMPLYHHFSQSAIKERITAIMKLKKISRSAILLAAGLVTGVTAAFATSATHSAAAVSAATTDELSERSEDWEDTLSPYLPFGLTYQYDREQDYFRMYFQGKEVRSIFDPQEEIYIAEHLGITADTFDEDAIALIAVYENGTLSGLRETTANETDETSHKRLQNVEAEPRINDHATAADYRSLFTLMTGKYTDLSLTDFNKKLLDWGNKHFDSYERIQEDFCRNDFQVSLSEDEYRFVSLTMRLSGEENFRHITHLKTGRPEEDPVVRFFPDHDRETDDGACWCGFACSFRYHIADSDKTTVGDRDRLIGSVLDSIQTFWTETSMDDLLQLTREDVLRMLEEIAARCGDDAITVTILEEQLYFEHMDERYTTAARDTMSIIHESADILRYEDGAPYIHDLLTNNTDRTIVETQYCMLAYNEKGSPLKLCWNFLDNSTESSFENIVRTKTNIPANQTEEYRGGWSLYDGKIMKDLPKVGDGEANQAVYALLCLKQVVFEDGTVWNNPDYENWFKKYAGKETTIDELQNYYPHEYKTEFAYREYSKALTPISSKMQRQIFKSSA